jgi:hypothetical protein
VRVMEERPKRHVVFYEGENDKLMTSCLGMEQMIRCIVQTQKKGRSSGGKRQISFPKR